MMVLLNHTVEAERTHYTNILYNRVARDNELAITWVNLQHTCRCIVSDEVVLYLEMQTKA